MYTFLGCVVHSLLFAELSFLAISAGSAKTETCDQTSKARAGDSYLQRGMQAEAATEAQEKPTEAEERAEFDAALDKYTERHDHDSNQEKTDQNGDDEEPDDEDNKGCSSLMQVLKKNGCVETDDCLEVKKQFAAADTNQDGWLCPKEIEKEMHPDKPLPGPEGNRSRAPEAGFLDVTQRRLTDIRVLWEAGKLDNATHMKMLLELFSEPHHLGVPLEGGEDAHGFAGPLGGEGSLAEFESAADDSVVNRTVYWGLPRRSANGWNPDEADSNRDGRLSPEEFRRAWPHMVGHGVSLLEMERHSAEFTSADADRDGFLDMTEVKLAFFERDNHRHGQNTYTFETPAVHFGAGKCTVAHPQWVGDGYCDKSGGYNTEACMWDGGDCCPETCSRGVHNCGNYDCQTHAVGHYRSRNPLFLDDRLDIHTFRTLFAWGKSTLARGCSSWNGESLSEGEWWNHLRAFNRGTMLQNKDNCGQGCGANMCGWIAKMYHGGAQFGHGARTNSREFGTGLCTRTGSYETWPWQKCLFLHEMSHTAGYYHPGYTGQEEWGSCHAIGSWYDHCNGDRCKVSGSSCTTHGADHSQGCGFLGMGCQAKCVKASYSMTAPERVCWCTRVRRGVRCGSQ